MVMRSTMTLAVVLGCAGFAQMRPALAQTLRCGPVLIVPGDDVRYVLEKCGDPTSSASMTAPMPACGICGYVYQFGIVRAGRWRYYRAPGQFPAVLSIADDGRVQDIEFDRTRD